MSNNIYYFPFNHVNRYVELSKHSLSELGYQVKSYRKLYSIANLCKRKHNTVLLNWFEDRPYRKSLSPAKQYLELLRTLLAIIMMPLFCRRVIWIRHNYLPHNLADGLTHNLPSGLAQNADQSPPDNGDVVVKQPLSHRLSCYLLGRLASEVVCMEKTPFATATVPHPLYRTDVQIEQAISATQSIGQGVSDDLQLDYVFFGCIKPYKKVHELLECWPVALRLDLLGYCADKHYAQQLNDIIVRRDLLVRWQNKYVDDQVLNHVLGKTRYVIMPHQDDSMISSGTFYHGASYGTNFLCFASKFASEKKQQHPFVHLVDKTRLEQDLASINYMPRTQVIAQSLSCYGQTAQQQAWQKLLA